MPPKKPSTSRPVPRSRRPLPGKAPRRPVGMQTLGPLGYAQLRQAIHQMAAEARESA
ncbi:MAG: hypothetical protein ABW123_11905 [Cystobacter sp.]